MLISTGKSNYVGYCPPSLLSIAIIDEMLKIEGFTKFGDESLNIKHDTKALCSVLQFLMQGYENNPPSIDNSTRWSDSTLEFFQSVVSASEIIPLTQVSYLPISISSYAHSCSTVILRKQIYGRKELEDM